MITLLIADIIPGEPAVLRTKVEKLRLEVKAGRKILAPIIARVGTEWMVRDGNHRIKAMQMEGVMEVDCQEDHPTEAMIRCLKALEPVKGFDPLPIVESQQEYRSHLVALGC